MSQYYRLDDTIRFETFTHHPESGFLTAAEETPQWNVFEDQSTTVMLNGNFSAKTGWDGSYYGSFHVSGVDGFEAGKYYSVVASGKVAGITDFSVVKEFVLNDIYDSNVVQIQSGEVVNSLNRDFYAADIKYIREELTDEYGVVWVKNNVVLNSGDVDNPAMSVYRAADGSTLFANQTLDYTTVSPLILTHTESSNIQISGEPYNVVVSGLIDSSYRTWSLLVGVDVIV